MLPPLFLISSYCRFMRPPSPHPPFSSLCSRRKLDLMSPRFFCFFFSSTPWPPAREDGGGSFFSSSPSLVPFFSFCVQTFGSFSLFFFFFSVKATIPPFFFSRRGVKGSEGFFNLPPPLPSFFFFFFLGKGTGWGSHPLPLNHLPQLYPFSHFSGERRHFSPLCPGPGHRTPPPPFSFPSSRKEGDSTLFSGMAGIKGRPHSFILQCFICERTGKLFPPFLFFLF